MKNFYKKSQAGRSMVEMLGVLAIIGVLSVGGIAGYSKAMQKYKINKAIDQISTIITNVQTLISNTNNRGGLMRSYDLGVFPDDMQYVNDHIVRNTFGLYTMVTGGGNFWTLRYNVPGRDACVAILTQNWPAYRIYVAEYNKDDEFDITDLGASVSISQAGEACKKDVDNTIFMDFR